MSFEAAILAPGEAELKSRKKAPVGKAVAQACATATVWLAVTAEITRVAPRRASAGLAASRVPCCVAWATSGEARVGSSSFRSWAVTATPRAHRSSARMLPTSP